MADAVTGLSPEQYRAIIAESIRTAGHMHINNAEAIVGNMDSLNNKVLCDRCWDLVADAYYEKPKANDKNSCDFLDPGSFLDKED